jgi:hypothetical protein
MPSTDDQRGDEIQDTAPPKSPVTAPAPAGPLDRPPIASRELRLPDPVVPSHEEIIRRLTRLELHRRGLLFLCIVGTLTSITCMYIMRQGRSAEPGTVEVNRLVFRDAAGVPRDSIRLNESGTGIAFCDANGVKRAMFYTNPEGDTGWTLLNTDGKQRVSLGVLKDGRGLVAVCDDGCRHFIHLDERGLTLDANGQRCIGMGMTERGPNITITAENGAVLFNKP